MKSSTVLRAQHLRDRASAHAAASPAYLTSLERCEASAQRCALPSPSPHPLLRSEIQLVARLHIERRIPLVDVASGVGAVLAGGVAVGQERVAQCLGTLFGAPALGEGNEETLVAGEAVG